MWLLEDLNTNNPKATALKLKGYKKKSSANFFLPIGIHYQHEFELVYVLNQTYETKGGDKVEVFSTKKVHSHNQLIYLYTLDIPCGYVAALNDIAAISLNEFFVTEFGKSSHIKGWAYDPKWKRDLQHQKYATGLKELQVFYCVIEDTIGSSKDSSSDHSANSWESSRSESSDSEDDENDWYRTNRYNKRVSCYRQDESVSVFYNGIAYDSKYKRILACKTLENQIDVFEINENPATVNQKLTLKRSIPIIGLVDNIEYDFIRDIFTVGYFLNLPNYYNGVATVIGNYL